MQSLQVAFLGLGVMGGPMAGHLADAGHRLRVYNRTRAKTEQWLTRHPGTLAESAADAARDADVVIAMVSDDPDVREVAVGEKGAFHTMRKDAVFVDHSTASANLARELATEAEKRGLHFIDAPVTGGQAGAESGALTIMAGGDESVFERVRPVLTAYAKAATWMGPAGSGQLTKMVNQICVVGLLQALAEGVDFGLRAGLDMKRVLNLLSQGAAGSWQMQHRGPTMVEGRFDFGFAVDLMRKDLRICMEEAARNGAELSVARLVDSFYADIQAMGGGRWDTSSLIKRLRDA